MGSISVYRLCGHITWKVAPLKAAFSSATVSSVFAKILVQQLNCLLYLSARAN